MRILKLVLVCLMAALAPAQDVKFAVDVPLVNVAFSVRDRAGRLILETRFVEKGDALIWTLRLRNPTDRAIEVGDVALPLPMNVAGFGRGRR